MKSNIDLARGLAAKAENDLRVAEIGLEHGAPLDTVCFHCQQAAEKLLKALLTARNLNYPRTHDVLALLDLATRELPELAEFRESLLAFSSYAVGMRYDAAIYPNRDETVQALETVRKFRSAIHRLLPVEARP